MLQLADVANKGQVQDELNFMLSVVKGIDEAERRTKEIIEAYEVLGNSRQTQSV